MVTFTFNITVNSGEEIPVLIDATAPLFIVGANGSGKTTLVQHILQLSTQAGMRCKRIAAHREVTMRSSRIGMTSSSRMSHAQNSRSEELADQGRWMDRYAGERWQAVLFDLVSQENDLGSRVLDKLYAGKRDEGYKIVETESRPFDRINELLSSAGLPIKIKYNPESGMTTAIHKTAESFSYDMAQMSDGERSAVQIAAEVLTAEKESILLIEEPERHLHSSIVVPFLTALFAERPDCCFVISTHELALPKSNRDAEVLTLRSFNPHTQSDVTLLTPKSDLPEWIRREMIGAREKILFVEGEAQSLDMALYEILFPNVSVRPVSSCGDVIKAVKGIAETRGINDFEAFGLIDGDGRDDVDRLECFNIYALSAYSVESLYYSEKARSAIARLVAEEFGDDVDEMLADAKRNALKYLHGNGKEMAARVCEQQMRARVENQMHALPTWKEIMEGREDSTCIRVSINYSDEIRQYDKWVKDEKLDAIITRYRVLKNKGLRNSIAGSLGFKKINNQIPAERYENTVVTQVRKNDELADSLRGLLPQALVDAITKQPPKDNPHANPD